MSQMLLAIFEKVKDSYLVENALMGDLIAELVHLGGTGFMFEGKTFKVLVCAFTSVFR